jgi:2-amino-4-hydroxy-6-hydroxymethyldihydropteridine diphosphokinase
VVAYIGVGSDIEPERNVAAAVAELKQHATVLAVSTFYWSPALRRPDAPRFLNGVVKIETALAPRDLKFSVLRPLESRLGRTRSADKYAPRTIDLDLLLYGSRVIEEADLRVPDPDIRTRVFLAGPLVEVDAGLCLPGTGEPIAAFVDDEALRALEPARDITQRLRETI